MLGTRYQLLESLSSQLNFGLKESFYYLNTATNIFSIKKDQSFFTTLNAFQRILHKDLSLIHISEPTRPY